MNVNTARLGKFCVVEWIQGSKAGRRETVSRDLVQLQPERGPGACRVCSFTDSNQYSPAVLHFQNDDLKIISMWIMLSSNISEKNAKVPSVKASRKRQRPHSPAAVQRVGRGHTDLDYWTDKRRYIVVQADDSVRRQYACVPRSWIKGTSSPSLALGTSCDVAWPAEIEKMGPWARLGYSPSPVWGLRRVICVYATDNFDAGQDWIRKMTNGQPIFSGDPHPEKVPRIYNSSRRFTGHQLTNTPLPSVRAVVNELHEMSVCHDTNAPFLPAPYNTEEFRKLITSYNCIQTPLRPANSVPDHTVTPTPVLCPLAKIPYVGSVRSSRANSSSSTIQSPKTTSFSTSARNMFCNAPSTHTSEIRSLRRPSVPTPLPPSNLAPATSIPIVASTSVPVRLTPSNLAPATSIPIVASTSVPVRLTPSNLAPATSLPIVASTSVPVPLPPSNLAPATSIPIVASTSVPVPLPPSNLAPATSIPIVASTSVPVPLPPSNLAPATSIPIVASTLVPVPLLPSNLAPATSISIVESTSVPIPLPPSNLAPATSESVPSSKLQSFTSALSLLHVSAATSTALLPSISATPNLSQNSAPVSTTLASSDSSMTPLILSSSVVTPSQASSPVGNGVSSSIAHPSLPKAKSPNTTTRAEPNPSQCITKRHIRTEFIKLINKITVLHGELENMCNRTVKGIHSSSLKFQESMKPFYDFCLLKNNDVAVEAN